MTGFDRLFGSPPRLDDPVGPLWRTAQVFRLGSFVYALGFQVVINGDLDRPGLTWVLFGLMTAANIWWAVGYLVGFGRQWWFVASEVAVSVVLMLSTSYVADTHWVATNQTWPTTLWMTNCVLSAALFGGATGGLISGGVVGLANFYVKGDIALNFGRNATFLLLLMTGFAVGLAASRARITHQRLTAAVRAAAQASERERLAREVHDGVLQVLALVARRGREIGGDAADLARLAAEQEQRLRKLIADQPAVRTECGVTDIDADLGTALRELGGPAVSVSAPAEQVRVPAHTRRELLAAVRNILENTTRHAGENAHSFILLEDLDDEVVISVRDNGAGIAPGRLDEARAEGRMGIARSIVGRLDDLGGRAQLQTAPGSGTEWELTIPLTKGGRTR